MADEMLLEIVTPERLVFSDVVEEVTIPGYEGQFGVLKGHVPLLGMVRIGELNYTRRGKKTYYVIGEGYVEVTGRKVSVLVDFAAKGDDVEREEAAKKLEEAQRRLSELTPQDGDYENAKRDVELYSCQIKAADKTMTH